MTTINVSKADNIYRIEATGHATGSEKVCSGVSAILYALAGWLINNDEHVTYAKRKLKSGDAFIEFSGDEKAKAVYDMAVIGLLQIEQSYPEYVNIKK